MFTTSKSNLNIRSELFTKCVFVDFRSCADKRMIPNRMPEASNITDKNNIVDPAAQARLPVIILVYLPTFLISELGNGFVIYSVTYGKRRQRTTIDRYILNLAIADILITTLSLFNGIEYVKNEWKLGEATCKIHGQMMEVCYTISTFTLLAITFERLKAVKDPFKMIHAKKTLRRNLLIIWLVACLLTSPLSYAYAVKERNDRYHCSNTNFTKMSRSIYYLLQGVILFFLPVTAMIVCQKRITRGLRQHSQIYKETMDCRNTHWKKVMTQEKRVGKLLCWI